MVGVGKNVFVFGGILQIFLLEVCAETPNRLAGLSIYPTLTPNHNPNTNRLILTTDPNRFVRGAESALFKHRGRYNKKARHPALFLVAKIFQPFPSVAAGKKKTFWEEAKKPLQSSMALEVIHWNSVKHADCCALNNLQET
jgi:hypothetical protein